MFGLISSLSIVIDFKHFWAAENDSQFLFQIGFEKWINKTNMKSFRLETEVIIINNNLLFILIFSALYPDVTLEF